MFSIVIPLYNKELSIRNTIQSVLDQAYKDFEIIVINDGSTDDSINVVQSFDDSRIKIVNQINQGVSATRNTGIVHSTCEWIAFLDADDLWEPNHLQEIRDMMQSFPNKNIYVTSFAFSGNRKKETLDNTNKVYLVDNYFKQAKKIHILWTSIVVVKKETILKVGGFDIRMTNGEDLDCWVRLAKSNDIVKSDKVTAIYRLDAENRTTLPRNLESSNLYYIDLDSIYNSDEKDYYINLILIRLRSYHRRGDLYNFKRLKSIHKCISWKKYASYLIRQSLKSMEKKLKI